MPEEALDVLKSLAPTDAAIAKTADLRDGVARLRMESAVQPDRLAVVASPGDRWFSLGIDGGFEVLQFDEGSSRSEIVEHLEDFTAMGVDYLLHGAKQVKDSRAWFPKRVLSLGGVDVVARLSVQGSIRHLFMRGFRWSGSR